VERTILLMNNKCVLLMSIS